MDVSAYTEPVREFLQAGPTGMMLVSPRHCEARARTRLAAAKSAEWFPGARAPRAAFAGLWLRYGGWTEAHEIAQEIPSDEGSYWHAIIHRQEPDEWNAGYWFRRFRGHNTFGDLARRASEVSPDFAGAWDPIRFIRYCESARERPEGDRERIALEVQEIEWELLFAYCALPPAP